MPPSPGIDEWLFRAWNLAGSDPILDRFMIFFTILTGVYVIFLVAVPLWWRGVGTPPFAVLLPLPIPIAPPKATNSLVDQPSPGVQPPTVNPLAGNGAPAGFVRPSPAGLPP